MTNELKKQSKQIEIETKSTNIVATNEINEDLVDANTIANRLNTTIDNVIHKIQSLNIQPKTYIMKGAKKNVKTALYSWEEIKQQQQHPPFSPIFPVLFIIILPHNSKATFTFPLESVKALVSKYFAFNDFANSSPC